MKTIQQMAERRRALLSGEGNFLVRLRRFLVECLAELKQVQRPSREEVTSYSIVVLIVVLAFAIYMAILDSLLGTAFQWFRIGGAR